MGDMEVQEAKGACHIALDGSTSSSVFEGSIEASTHIPIIIMTFCSLPNLDLERISLHLLEGFGLWNACVVRLHILVPLSVNSLLRVAELNIHILLRVDDDKRVLM
jgi:hypothetical protein